jgi:hypothetical protein
VPATREEDQANWAEQHPQLANGFAALAIGAVTALAFAAADERATTVAGAAMGIAVAVFAFLELGSRMFGVPVLGGARGRGGGAAHTFGDDPGTAHHAETWLGDGGGGGGGDGGGG